MQRRTFIQAGVPLALGGAVALSSAEALAATPHRPAAESELIEWRTYDLAWGGNQALLMRYLKDALEPALRGRGATQFVTFKEYGDPSPGKLHVMISYPDAATYVSSQDLSGDATFAEASREYDALAPAQPIFSRYSSWLLSAFTGMPRSVAPDASAGLFELRIYEGYSEDATRRKIGMFNDYEIKIFDDTGLKPVFYADMIAGPHRPALIYLLQFEDMQQRDENWVKFGADPTWNTINKLEKYADSVSNIVRTFLVPA